MNVSRFRVRPGSRVSLRSHNPADTGGWSEKADAKDALAESIETLAAWQDMLYARDAHAVLIIFQAMDAAGKDGVIKHVMTGINPQGCQVYSFKAPSPEELDHDFLWRCQRVLPERGRIGIFNRSYYEEVLVVRVHPELLEKERLPKHEGGPDLWKRRFQDINAFERHLIRNGTSVVKFFLNVSREVQKERFLERIDKPGKNWKFSYADVLERRRWSDYMHAYEEMLSHTSTRHAPWYIIPADHSWFTRAAVAAVIVRHLAALDLHYPVLDPAQHQELRRAKRELEREP
jgi:PPK2 family polyphosphate:nucleotide phosphotransferase